MAAGDARAQVDGLLAWWALAGVDGSVSETPVNWLRPEPVRAPESAAAAQGSRPSQLPDTLPAFHAYLANATDLPEARWPGARLLPSGPQAPRLMIIFAAPEAEGAMLSADAEKLFGRMLAAIGLRPEQCYFSSLSLVAPAGGMIDQELENPLAQRMRHHIGLVAPEALLLIGDQTSRALGQATGAASGQNLPFVNQSGGNINAATIIHPRLLLRQPAAKAGIWRVLQGLAGGLAT